MYISSSSELHVSGVLQDPIPKYGPEMGRIKLLGMYRLSLISTGNKTIFLRNFNCGADVPYVYLHLQVISRKFSHMIFVERYC